MGFPKERYQMLTQKFPLNKPPGTPQDLTSAATTSLGIFGCPKGWGGMDIVAMGIHFAAAGGAESPSGTAKLQIAGTDVNYSSVATGDNLGANVLLSSVPNHAAWSESEIPLNIALGTADGKNGAAKLVVPAPVYPNANQGQKVEMLVVTQGITGDQTGYVYLLVRQGYSDEAQALNN